MFSPQTLLEEDQSLEVFKEMLLSTLSLKKPIIQLKNIPQWVGFLKSVNITHTPLSNCSTFLLNGFFYNFSSPLSINALDLRQQADIHLISTLRNEYDTSILEDKGFIKIPSYIESCLEIKDSIDFQLRQYLGGKRYRDIIRSVDKGRSYYPLTFYNWRDIERNNYLLTIFAKLHEYNAMKYNHTYNLYNHAALKKLFESVLKKNIFIGLRYDKENNCYVQGFIFLVSQKYSDIYLLAQGSNANIIRKGNNLYTAMFYELFKFAYTEGFSNIYLGRGNQNSKKKIGANKFYLLHNLFYTKNIFLEKHLKKTQCYSNILYNTYNSLIG